MPLATRAIVGQHVPRVCDPRHTCAKSSSGSGTHRLEKLAAPFALGDVQLDLLLLRLREFAAQIGRR
jgi:hypothetical protein